MNIRKIGVVGTFAAGAALALAPLASATTDPSTPDATGFDFSDVVKGEESSLNFLFDSQATLAGDGKDVVAATATNPFDTIPSADLPVVTDAKDLTTLDYLLYGLDPIKAGLASDPGSYNVLNGALTEFDDAFNVELYSALHKGALIDADDLFGSSHTIDTALGTTADPSSVSDAFDTFFQAGIGDLEGYFDLG